MDKGDFVRGGFEVFLSTNGGILVLKKIKEPRLFTGDDMAAFSTPREFVDWLGDEFRLNHYNEYSAMQSASKLWQTQGVAE
jgi:hypothetical protein